MKGMESLTFCLPLQAQPVVQEENNKNSDYYQHEDQKQKQHRGRGMLCPNSNKNKNNVLTFKKRILNTKNIFLFFFNTWRRSSPAYMNRNSKKLQVDLEAVLSKTLHKYSSKGREVQNEALRGNTSFTWMGDQEMDLLSRNKTCPSYKVVLFSHNLSMHRNLWSMSKQRA